MRQVIVPVEIESLEEGGFLAVCNLIQGCHAEGETVAEALDILEGIARILLELRVEDGLPLPDGLEAYSPATAVKAQLIVQLPE
jgi:predicted RNase H-like HicB family nuclease